jgi:hypothetical protein
MPLTLARVEVVEVMLAKAEHAEHCLWTFIPLHAGHAVHTPPEYPATKDTLGMLACWEGRDNMAVNS